MAQVSQAVSQVQRIVRAVRDVVGPSAGPQLLHGPHLAGNELTYLKECIDTAWVSMGSFVNRFEHELQKLTGAARAIATVNGTAALHLAMRLAGVEADDEVLVPSLTFVATANAVNYCHAAVHLCDIERRTLGMDPQKLNDHLSSIAVRTDGVLRNRQTQRRISAIVPMHTFGHPADLDGLCDVAGRWGLPIIEDAAESLGSEYRSRHTGSFGRLGVLSFNGNKIVTTGGGGAILTSDQALAERAEHLASTAKVAHPWEFLHDEIGYNYRMPNLNAALGCAQLEQLPEFLILKRRLAAKYIEAFEGLDDIEVLVEPAHCRSNYWLNTLILGDGALDAHDRILAALNGAKLQSRPVWRPMHELPMFAANPRMDLSATEDMARRIINVPSSAALGAEA